jgi:hypothetical protein
MSSNFYLGKKKKWKFKITKQELQYLAIFIFIFQNLKIEKEAGRSWGFKPGVGDLEFLVRDRSDLEKQALHKFDQKEEQKMTRKLGK